MDNSTSGAKARIEGVGQGLHSLIGALRVLFFVLRIVIIICFVALIFSGVFTVKEHQEALLFHFGKLQTRNGSEILTSGKWYWAWPYPIDRVDRIPAQRSVTLSTDDMFWPLENPNLIAARQPGARGGQPLGPGAGGYLLTGDANIMHMKWTITYRVRDAKRYYLHFFQSRENGASQTIGATAAESDDHDHDHDEPAGPPGPPRPPQRRGAEGIIRSTLAEAVLTELANWSVEDVLVLSRKDPDTGARLDLDSAVEQRLVHILEVLDLGIEVQQVSLSGSKPPEATIDAFTEVVKSAQEYRNQVEIAQAEENAVVLAARGEASDIKASAKAYQTQVVASVKAARDYFEEVLEQYRENPKTMLVALYTNAIRDVLSRVETKFVIHAKEDGPQEIRLLLGPEDKDSSSDQDSDVINQER